MLSSAPMNDPCLHTCTRPDKATVTDGMGYGTGDPNNAFLHSFSCFSCWCLPPVIAHLSKLVSVTQASFPSPPTCQTFCAQAFSRVLKHMVDLVGSGIDWYARLPTNELVLSCSRTVGTIMIFDQFSIKHRKYVAFARKSRFWKM